MPRCGREARGADSPVPSSTSSATCVAVVEKFLTQATSVTYARMGTSRSSHQSSAHVSRTVDAARGWETEEEATDVLCLDAVNDELCIRVRLLRIEHLMDRHWPQRRGTGALQPTGEARRIGQTSERDHAPTVEMQ